MLGRAINRPDIGGINLDSTVLIKIGERLKTACWLMERTPETQCHVFSDPAEVPKQDENFRGPRTGPPVSIAAGTINLNSLPIPRLPVESGPGGKIHRPSSHRRIEAHLRFRNPRATSRAVLGGGFPYPPDAEACEVGGLQTFFRDGIPVAT